MGLNGGKSWLKKKKAYKNNGPRWKTGEGFPPRSYASKSHQTYPLQLYTWHDLPSFGLSLRFTFAGNNNDFQGKFVHSGYTVQCDREISEGFFPSFLVRGFHRGMGMLMMGFFLFFLYVCMCVCVSKRREECREMR